MDHFTIPAALFQALGAYLIERPYREVAPLVDGLRLAAGPAPAPAAPEPPAAGDAPVPRRRRQAGGSDVRA